MEARPYQLPSRYRRAVLGVASDGARRLHPARFVASVLQKQSDNTVWRNSGSCEVPHCNPVVSVCPQVLSRQEQIQLIQWKQVSNETLGTHPNRILSSGSKPWRLYQLEGHILGIVQRVQLPNSYISMADCMVKRDPGGLTSMTTVPFWVGPLQYCAGYESLLVQSG